MSTRALRAALAAAVLVPGIALGAGDQAPQQPPGETLSGQGQPAPGSPASGQVPEGQPPQQPAAPPETAVAPPAARTFTAPVGLLFNAVRPERQADFEKVIAYLRAALAKSSDPTVRAQAKGWRIFKAAEPGPGGTLLYVFALDPTVPSADYGLGRILAEAYPDPKQLQEIWKLYQGAVTSGGSLLNLTPVPAAPVTALAAPGAPGQPDTTPDPAQPQTPGTAPPAPGKTPPATGAPAPGDPGGRP